MKLAARIARASLAFVVGIPLAFIVPFAYAALAWETEDWFKQALGDKPIADGEDRQ